MDSTNNQANPSGERINNKCLLNEMLDWFNGYETEEQMKILSMTNGNFTSNIIKMYRKLNNHNNVKFKLKFNNELSDLNYIDGFKTMNYNDCPQDEKMSSYLFLKEVMIYSLIEEDDTITLSSSLMKDKKMFKYYLTIFSKEKIFRNACEYVYTILIF